MTQRTHCRAGWRSTAGARDLTGGFGRGRAFIRLLTALACFQLLAAPLAAPLAAQLGPQTVVREFCQADATGARASIQGWSRIAALVEWPLEPAWDRVALVTSYTIGSPQPAGDDQLAIEVRYLVTARLTAVGVNEAPEVESVTFRVRGMGTSWRIVGPPPPPHIFAQHVDAKAMQASLQNGGVNFLPNSLFVWSMFQSAGWDVERRSTADLLDGKVYRAVKEAKPGDLVVYLRDDVPYHVGLLEAEGQVVSSTLNAGIMRSSGEAFAGEVRFLRLVQPQAASTASAAPTPASGAPGSAARRTPTAVTPKATSKKPSSGPAARKKVRPAAPAKPTNALPTQRPR